VIFLQQILELVTIPLYCCYRYFLAVIVVENFIGLLFNCYGATKNTIGADNNSLLMMLWRPQGLSPQNIPAEACYSCVKAAWIQGESNSLCEFERGCPGALACRACQFTPCFFGLKLNQKIARIALAFS
jgi:hypothetical protein